MAPPDPKQPFVTGVISTAAGDVPRVSARLTSADRVGTVKVRLGIGRHDYGYAVDPGLYAVGEPDDTSPVLVTANYKLTFDVVRSSLAAVSAWLLVLDTRGVNVWCAAGKGTFSTEELVRRVRYARLEQVVSHHRLIVPQLGATGVSAHVVRREARFAVVYGPVRAADLPGFLDAGFKATPEMRAPTFRFAERLVLTPVELVGSLRWVAYALAVAVVLALLGTRPIAPLPVLLAALRNLAPALLGLFAGAVLVPALLPWIPARMFAAKGAILGGLLGLAWAALVPAGVLAGASAVMLCAAVASFAAMNFTGSTPFTSMSGVEREMRRWLPVQIGGVAVALVGLLLKGFVR